MARDRHACLCFHACTDIPTSKRENAPPGTKVPLSTRTWVSFKGGRQSCGGGEARIFSTRGHNLRVRSLNFTFVPEADVPGTSEEGLRRLDMCVSCARWALLWGLSWDAWPLMGCQLLPSYTDLCLLGDGAGPTRDMGMNRAERPVVGFLPHPAASCRGRLVRLPGHCHVSVPGAGSCHASSAPRSVCRHAWRFYPSGRVCSVTCRWAAS